MKTAVLAVLMVVSASLCAAAKNKGGIGPQTDFKNMPPEQVVALLQNAQSIKIDGPIEGIADRVKNCNGHTDKWNSEMLEERCVSVASFYIPGCGSYSCQGILQVRTGIPFNDPRAILTAMQALFRGCGLYAPASSGQSGDGVSCGLLGALFLRIGNPTAAKVVWEQAPGCNSVDHVGNATNGCVRYIVGPNQDFPDNITPQIYASNPQKLLKMASDACNNAQDPSACAFLKRNGAQIDMEAINQENRDRRNEEKAHDKQATEDRAEKSRESDARFNAVMGALQGMPGANDPNAIVNAGNQQAAAIRSIGNANAAGKQSTSTYSTAPSYAPQTASSGNSGATNSSSSGSQSNSGTTASSPSASPASQPQTVAAVPQCITVQTKGDGTFTLTNFCPYPVNVSFTQPGDSLDADASLLQNETVHEGDTSKPFTIWACPSPYTAIDLSTNHQDPRYTSTSVACAVGNAGSGS